MIEAKLLKETPSRYLFDVCNGETHIWTYTVMVTNKFHSPELLESARQEAVDVSKEELLKQESWEHSLGMNSGTYYD